MAKTARIGHASLFHGADPAYVAKYLLDFIEGERLTHLTTTEATPAMLTQMRKCLPRGWWCNKQDEYLSIWNTKVWRQGKIRPRVVQLTHVTTGAGDWRNLDVRFHRMIHLDTKRRVQFATGHAASGVEMGARWRSDSEWALGQVKISQQGLDAWGAHNRYTMRRAPRLGLVNAGDFNLNQQLPIWVKELEQRLDLRSMWHTVDPKIGTHGSRTIESVHSNLKMSDPHVSKVAANRLIIDHQRGVVVTITL